MKIEGRYTFNLPIQEVYDALRDEELLREALPGKVDFKMTSSTHYEAAMDLDVPKFGGHYAGSVDITDTQAPHYYQLSVKGTGMGRDVTAKGRIELTQIEPSKTEVHYVGTTDALDGYNRFVKMAAPSIAARFANRALNHLEPLIIARKGNH
jgi:carbon monoxide dehydrogenase subunit G